MKLGVIMKRFYTNRDLIKDRYGRMFHIPRILAKMGWEVKVFCLDFHTRESFTCAIEGVEFHSIPARLAGALMNRSNIESFQADIWLASGQLFAARHARSIATQRSVPWIVDFYDYYPAFYPSLIRPSVDAWAHRLIRMADGIVSASKALCDWAARSNDKSVIIPNGVDRAVFYSRDPRKARETVGLDANLNLVGYFGSLNFEHGLLDTIEAVELLKKRGEKIQLVCAGSSNQVDLIRASGAIWLGMLPQDELANAICACDCVLAPYPKSDQVYYSNSCRLTEYLACSVPIIATRVGDHSQLLPDDYPGLADPGDPRSIAMAIQRQLSNSALAPLPADLEWDKIGAKLDSFLAQLVAYLQQRL